MSDEPKVPGQVAERFHPGEYLRDEMEARGWSKETLAEKCGIGLPRVEAILAEKWNLTMLDCRCIAKAFDTDERTWRNLQQSFDDWKAPTKGESHAE